MKKITEYDNSGRLEEAKELAKEAISSNRLANYDRAYLEKILN
jgi:hypothetical protein